MKFLGYKKSSNYLNLLSVFILVIGMVMACLVYATKTNFKYDAKIISETGVIRGGIQQVTKLVLSGSLNKPDKNFRHINRLLDKFTTQKGNNYSGLDKTLIKSATQLKQQWLTLEYSLTQYQLIPSIQLYEKIIKESKICWKNAITMVLTAQHIAEYNVNIVGWFFYILIILNTASIVFILFLISSYVKNKLEYESSHDHLTSLYNRRSYEYAIEYEVTRNTRYGSRLSLILFDIDHFKIINDTFGHNIGDHVIVAITKLIKDSIRHCDLFFRVGGEEFAIICPETNTFSALKLAEKVRKKIENHNFDSAGKATISLGIAELLQGLTKDHLHSHADQAMYNAKHSGRNCTKVFVR